MKDLITNEKHDVENLFNDGLIVVADNENVEMLVKDTKECLKHLSEGGSAFRYIVKANEHTGKTKEINVNLIFESHYMQMIYSDMVQEMALNEKRLENLESQDLKMFISSSLMFDYKIDELRERNEELEKKLKIVKMQLFNAINKRNKVLEDIKRYIQNIDSKCLISYVCEPSDLEKSFIDFESIC